MAKFEFDESAIQKMAQDATRKLAAQLTRALNGLITQYEGRPLDEVKSAVQETWARNSGGGSITDPQLTAFAEAITAGRSVEVHAE